MYNLVKLSKAANYSTTRIDANKVSLLNYVTTDSILQNKAGISIATNLPPGGGTMPAFNPNNILVGNIRPYLKKIWFSNMQGGCSADVLVFDVNKHYDPQFIYYCMFKDDFFSHVMKGAKGTKMPRGDKNQILNFLIPNIELTYQKKISSLLSVLDEKIALNQQINIQLDSMAKMLFDYWFVQFNFPNKNGQPYKTSGGEMKWNESLKREIPLGWDTGTLLDIAEYTNGLACQKYRPIDANFLRVIKIKEMNEGFSDNSESVRANVPQKIIIKNGDVLFSWSASLDVKIWTGGKGALNQHIFKVASNRYPKSFYYFQLVNYLQHFKMMAETRKTTMGHITLEHLQQSRIAIPPTALIMKLDEILAPIFSMKINNEVENQKLSELRDWLLPMLMNNQVKVYE
ncbi:MAG: restriction endonuclease subunit S [Methylotenera sp.]|nr:restriction endonuclease subunit S [Methylotenera sp.]